MAASALILGILLTAACGEDGACQTQPATARPAATEARSFLLVAGDWLRLEEGTHGGEFRADWVHRTSARVFQAGYSNYRLDTAEWSLGRLAYYQRFHPRAAWSGELRLGPGRLAGDRFTYQKYRLGLTFFGRPGLVLFIDDEYLRIAGVRVNLLSGGAQVQRGDWTFKGVLLASTGGDSRTRFGYGRIDRQWGRIRLFGGAGGGRSVPEVFDLPGSGPAGGLRQVFGGAAIRRGRWELILSVDFLDQPTTNRLTSSAGVRIPLR